MKLRLIVLIYCCLALTLLPGRADAAANPPQIIQPAGPPLGIAEEACGRNLSAASAGLTGTGMFIWKVSAAEGGDPAAIAATAREAGLSFVLIKVADGASPYGIESAPQNVLRQPTATPVPVADLPPGVTPTAPASAEIDRVAPVVKALKAAGIKAWGWHYLRGDDPAGEAQQAIQRIRSLGLDGYTLDVETEYKRPNMAQAALIFMEALRNAYPSLPVALNSYSRPSYHPELPWEEFLCYADFAMPQVYWINAQNPDELLRNSVSEYTALPNARPIIPVGAAFSQSGWRPSADEISLFRDTVRALNLPAASYWSWDQARSPGNEDLWAAISGGSTWPVYSANNSWLPSNDIRALAYTRTRDGVPNLIVASAEGLNKVNGSLSASYLIPTIQVEEVVANTSVGMQLINFPANLDFEILMSPFGTSSINGIYVTTIRTSGTEPQAVTVNIPAELTDASRIAVRMQNLSSGYYSYATFENSSPRRLFATLQPTLGPIATAVPECDYFHVVRPGESLAGIGRWYGVDWPVIAQMNDIPSPGYSIYPGQNLCIQASGFAQPQWHYYITEVVRNTSLSIEAQNFPKNALYQVRIGKLIAADTYDWRDLPNLDSGEGGNFSASLSIPAEFAGNPYLSLQLTLKEQDGSLTSVTSSFPNLDPTTYYPLVSDDYDIKDVDIVEIAAQNFVILATNLNIQLVDFQRFDNIVSFEGGAEVIGVTSDRYLWAGSDDGLKVYDLTSFALVNLFTLDQLGTGSVNALAVSNDDVWVGGQGKLVNIHNGQVTPRNLPDELTDAAITTLAAAPGGALWVGTSHGAARWDGNTWEIITTANGLVSSQINEIVFDAQGGVWFATPAGAIRFDPAQRAWRRYFEAAYPIVPSDNIRSLLVDPDGTVWLGTDAGLAGLQGQPVVTTIYRYDNRGPGSPHLTGLALDEQTGNLWLSSLDSGLSLRLAEGSQSNGAGGEWRTFDRDTSRLPANAITTLAIDEQGRAWAGTANNLAICNPQGCQPVQSAPDVSLQNLRLLELDAAGNAWVVYQDGLAWCHPECEAVAVQGEISLLKAATDGTLWVGTTDQGVYVCQGTDCQVNPALGPLPTTKSIAPAAVMLAAPEGHMVIAIPPNILLDCTPGNCQEIPLSNQTINGLAIDHSEASRLWVMLGVGDPVRKAYIALCTLDGCERQSEIIQLERTLISWLHMFPGPAGDMWIAAERGDTFYCRSPESCTQTSASSGASTLLVQPAAAGQAWIANRTSGLQFCTPDQCRGTPATGVALTAQEPAPGQPWVRLTPNASLYGLPDKLVDIQKLLIEFEGGSLTTPALELGYQIILSDTLTGQTIVSQAFSRGAIGSASPGQVSAGDKQPLEYHPYQLSVRVEDSKGMSSRIVQQFVIQASPSLEVLQLSAGRQGQAEGSAPIAVTLPRASTYQVLVRINDPDSSGPFALQYRWAGSEPKEATTEDWQNVENLQYRAEGVYSGEMRLAESIKRVSGISIRAIDPDNNQREVDFSISFNVPRPLWVVVTTYILGVLTVVMAGLWGMRRYSGLPVSILARQGVNIFSVSLGYRNYQKDWAASIPFERLVLLLIPPRDAFRPESLLKGLQQLDIPVDEAQVERTVQALIQEQWIELAPGASGEYRACDTAQLSALQVHIGLPGVIQLCQLIRSEHPLLAEARRFFTAAGFDAQVVPDLLALNCTPALPSWQKLFDRPIFARLLVGEPVSHIEILQAQEEVQARPEFNQKVVFIVVDRTPTDSAWLQIGTLRATDVQIIPIDDTIIQAGREQQKERDALEAHLRRFLGRRRDLYNVRTPVTDRLNFFGREARARELLETVAEGNPVILLALRKMGKSSVLLYLRDRAPFPIAHIDLQDEHSMAGLYARILESLQRSLRVKYPGVNWSPPDLSQQESLAPLQLSEKFSAAVRELINALENAGRPPLVGLFIDEIEVITPRENVDGSPADVQLLERYLAFARTLRGLLQETRRLALMVVGVDPRLNRVNRWGAEQNPFYQFFREEYLSPLSREDCIQMVRNIGQQMGLAYTDEAVEYAADLSGGHPFLARQLCSLAIQEAGEALGGTMTLDYLQAAAGRFVRDPNTEALLNERGLWGEISNRELWPDAQVTENQDILSDLAAAQPQAEPDLLQSGGNRMVRERALFELKQRYVVGVLNALLRIQFGIFSDWIKRYKLGGD